MTLDDASASKASCWELPRNGHDDAYDGNDGILDNFQKGVREECMVDFADDDPY